MKPVIRTDDVETNEQVAARVVMPGKQLEDYEVNGDIAVIGGVWRRENRLFWRFYAYVGVP